MMSANEKMLQFLVEGGKATAGPPIGPALGPLGLNVMAVVKEINEKTKDFMGMRVPVKVYVNVEKKTFRVEVGIPTTAALIIKELKKEKGGSQAGKEVIGSLELETIIKIALMKGDALKSKNLKNKVKQVLGTCLSMGVNVNGKNPKEIIKEIDDGLYDEIFRKYGETK